MISLRVGVQRTDDAGAEHGAEFVLQRCPRRRPHGSENPAAHRCKSATSTPNSSRALRATAPSTDSSGDGCPQNELVHTPGKVRLSNARRVNSTWPASSKR